MGAWRSLAVPVSDGAAAVVHQVAPSTRKPVALTVTTGGVLSATSGKVAVARLPAASWAVAVIAKGPSGPDGRASGALVSTRAAADAGAPSVSVSSSSVRTGAGSSSSVATAVISTAPRTRAPGAGVAPKVMRGGV
jgi:hypothetical protein